MQCHVVEVGTTGTKYMLLLQISRCVEREKMPNKHGKHINQNLELVEADSETKGEFGQGTKHTMREGISRKILY